MFTCYRPPGDAWTRLASMVNLLEKLAYPRKMVIHGREAHGGENGKHHLYSSSLLVITRLVIIPR